MTLYAKMDIQVNEINQNGISHFNPEAMHVSDQSAIEWLSELDTRKNENNHNLPQVFSPNGARPGNLISDPCSALIEGEFVH